MVSSIAGFKSLDPDVMDLARSTGAGSWRLFVEIRLPQALPDIFTGLKVGAALAATAAVVAEFGLNKGLGYLLLEYNGNLETGMVFAVIIVLSLIGLAIYYAVEFLERITIHGTCLSAPPRRTCRWHEVRAAGSRRRPGRRRP